MPGASWLQNSDEITITKKGLHLLEEVEEKHKSFRQKTPSKLTKEEAISLSKLLDKIREE